jgi:hypothetical protein
MNSIKVATILSELDNELSNAIRNSHAKLTEDFSSSTQDNERTELEANMHEAMAQQKIAAKLATRFKSAHDASKKDLDTICDRLGVSPDPVPGTTTNLYEDKLYIFSKRQNVDSSVCSAKDLITELNKLGVDPTLITEAQKKATKPKKGNTYYNVEVKEDEG